MSPQRFLLGSPFQKRKTSVNIGPTYGIKRTISSNAVNPTSCALRIDAKNSVVPMIRRYVCIIIATMFAGIPNMIDIGGRFTANMKKTVVTVMKGV